MEEPEESEEKIEEELEVFYETNAADLKDADRSKRWMRTIGFIGLYFIFTVVLYNIIFELSLIVLFLIMMFSPSPFIPTIAEYKITNKGILLSDGRKISINPEYKFIANEERNFVDIKKGRRDVLLVYTSEPMRVMKILEKVAELIHEEELKLFEKQLEEKDEMEKKNGEEKD